MCVYVRLCVTVCTWRSEDNFVKSVLSFRLYIVSLDQMQIARVEQQALIHSYLFAKQEVLMFKQSQQVDNVSFPLHLNYPLM